VCVLQFVYYSVLQCVAVCRMCLVNSGNSLRSAGEWQCVAGVIAVCVPQCVAVYCSVLHIPVENSGNSLWSERERWCRADSHRQGLKQRLIPYLLVTFLNSQCVAACCVAVCCVAVFCSMLQCVAVCVAVCAATCCNTLQHTRSAKAFTIIDNACNTLQYTSTHSNTLEHTATHLLCNTPAVQRLSQFSTSTSTLCNTPQLQRTATHCNTLQHTCRAKVCSIFHTDCKRLQKITTHCNTLQHTYNTPAVQRHSQFLTSTAAHYNILQHSASHCII